MIIRDHGPVRERPCAHLRQVVLSDYGDRLTPAGVARLRAARPACEIIVQGVAR